MTTILSINLTASVLILGIVLLRALALCRFPRKLFFLLWGIVALRLIIPVSLPVYLPDDFGETPAQIEVSNVPAYGEIITVPDTPPSTQAAPAPFEFPYEAIWLIGVCAVAIFFLVSYIRFRKAFRASETCGDQAVNEWLTTLPLKRSVQVRQSHEIGTALTYGIFHPVILLPTGLDLSERKQLHFILTHEAVHIRRFDAALKLLLTVVVCLHWFNPLVWVMYVLANRDVELSCDEAVVKELGYETRSEYAHILIGLVERRSRRAFPLVSYFGKHAEEERITSLMKVKRYSVAIIVAVVAVLLCGGVLAAFAVSSVEYVPLWENRSQEEIDTLTTYFDTEGADDYRIEGGTIYVPEKRIEDYKWLTLEATFDPLIDYEYESVYLEDLPSGDRDLAYIHALQNRLGEVIGEYAGVKEAVVIITDGKNSIPLASVMVTMKDENTALSDEQTTAIRRLVKDSVNGLTEENISIADAQGNFYKEANSAVGVLESTIYDYATVDGSSSDVIGVEGNEDILDYVEGCSGEEVDVTGQSNFNPALPSWSDDEEKLIPMTLISSFERRYKNQYRLIDEMEFSLTPNNPSAVYEGTSDRDIVISFVDNGPVICVVTIEGVEVPGTYKCGFSGEGAVRLELTPGATYSVEYQRGLKEHSDPTIYTGEIVDASSSIIKVYEAK